MKASLRQSMAWLHTWSGLLAGWVLFLVFAAGTASYFDDEITLWMTPEMHGIACGSGPACLRGVSQTDIIRRAETWLMQNATGSPRWTIEMPTARSPGLQLAWQVAPAQGRPDRPTIPAHTIRVTLDPATGLPVANPRSTRGGQFFSRLHYRLHDLSRTWGSWIVGACAMAMLVGIISGIITHRHIFKDFFTFRPRKGARSWLDAHAAAAVLALPFHLMITYTGLVTLMFTYMPWAVETAYASRGGQDAFLAEAFPLGTRHLPQASGLPSSRAPIGAMVEQASARWSGGGVGRIVVQHPDDAASVIILIEHDPSRISFHRRSIRFDATTGETLARYGDEYRPVSRIRGVLYGLHVGRFSSPLLRGLFFLSGLLGCVMVATGLLLWAVRSRQRHPPHRSLHPGLRLVDSLNLGTIAGVPIAVAAFFWANRLLPLDMPTRAEVEMHCFFASWAIVMVLALATPSLRMWQALLGAGALLFLLLPVLNALTTPTHLGVSLFAGPAAVAGFDIVSIALGLSLVAVVGFLRNRRATGSAS